jgi:hypothetical protein
VPLATGGRYWTAERSALLELQFGGEKGPNGQIRKSRPFSSSSPGGPLCGHATTVCSTALHGRPDAREWLHVMVEVFGAFTRALRDADLEKCEEHLRSSSRPRAAGILAGRDRGSCPICRSAQPCMS